MSPLLVISDLHMGSGPVDDFEPQIEKHFIEFLNESSNTGDGTELVINGDFLDFIQAPPYTGRQLRSQSKEGIPLCFTEDQSLKKLEAIYHAHRASFSAISAFIARRVENRLVILPGNHDADFYWPNVQLRFRDLICGDNEAAKQRLVFWLERVYRPPTFPNIWIEHGHQYDPINNFVIDNKPCWGADNVPIRADRKGVKRLYECIGTRFTIQFINELDLKYPYVDNIKPFSRFLQLFGASALIPGFGPLKAAVAVTSMTAFLAKTITTRPKDVLGFSDGKSASAADVVLLAFERAPASCQKAFISAVRERGFPLKSSLKIVLRNQTRALPFIDFLADNFDVLETIDYEPPNGVLKLAGAFRVNESEELRAAALKIVNDATNKADIVIMGHTHEPVAETAYINTGSWTRYYKLKTKEKLRPWSMLRAGSWRHFPYQLNYAVAEPGGRSTAKLRTYR